MARFDIPDGWTVQAYRYALDPTPHQLSMFSSHSGAARFAFNHMLALVKAVVDQRAAERTYGIVDRDLTQSIGWSLPQLRKIWNQRKHEYAPWWAENSKEAYNTGLDALARALDNWTASRRGQRAGNPVGFPKFKTAARSRRSVRFTTGTIRVEPSRHHIVLPRLGRLKTHESTRKLARRVETGTARILSATVTRDSRDRWYVSFQSLVEAKTRPAHARRSPFPVVGVDVGVTADALMVIATPDGREVKRIPAPKPLTAAQSRLRVLQRRAARQQSPFDPVTKTRRRPSKRWQATMAHVARTHGRTAAIRRDVLHQATTALAQQYEVVTVETLNAAGMRSAGGVRKKALNRALADAALAQIRQQLTYKSRWYGSVLVEADRWFPSSKSCSGCGVRKPSLTLADRVYDCEFCGLSIDRDRNAAINLARLGESRMLGEQSPAGSGPVAGRGAIQETEPACVGDAGGRETSTPHHHQVNQTGTASPQDEAA
ncbi:IS607 family element RNA-guided endonuclease TnpB [Nocardia sp. NPDC058519]|uniref:IS607 family element RNA-guided endonuclease TnpB n=1 Tax=Nocardia sp. NPDC058519 TaxID=3346535 RepID=UPI00365191FE